MYIYLGFPGSCQLVPNCVPIETLLSSYLGMPSSKGQFNSRITEKATDVGLVHYLNPLRVSLMVSNRVECHNDLTLEMVWWEPSSWLLFSLFMQFEDLAQFPDHLLPRLENGFISHFAAGGKWVSMWKWWCQRHLWTLKNVWTWLRATQPISHPAPCLVGHMWVQSSLWNQWQLWAWSNSVGHWAI